VPFYKAPLEQLIGLEPSMRLMKMAQNQAHETGQPVTFVSGTAEAIPLEDHSIDTIVTTWTLCSIPDVVGALKEMRRVLRPKGQLLFVEHGLAPETNIQRWQDRLTPLWRRIGGGCHLNRPIRVLIESAGFGITQLDTGYIRGPKPLTFFYEGRAIPM